MPSPKNLVDLNDYNTIENIPSGYLTDIAMENHNFIAR